ncbi:hypothetical protein FNV43_RR03181 [Rhamnella rubrinervis]|uniref:Proline-rich protein PRCC n=1 Tax=Rhamnella rubrinervis TaxID=2594499 RepID=A0A8K0HIM3_9ROSA|nr:hypothetical protein FNV43_RR03181 [Rhamnella rubrinervis]
MDSLLANYASSDDEREEEQQPPKHTAFDPPPPPTPFSSSTASSLFSALPKPKSSSLFQSLPLRERTLAKPSTAHADPLLGDGDDGEEAFSKPASRSSGTAPKSSSLFSKLPQPKSQFSQQQPSSPNLSSSESNTKRVVQVKLPTFSIKRSELDDDDDDDDDDEDKERKRRNDSDNSQFSTAKSFLTGILPAPKYSSTLGVLPTSGSGRRAIIDTEVAATNSGGATDGNDRVIVDQNAGSYGSNDLANCDASYGNYQTNFDNGSYDSFGNYQTNFDQNVGVSGQMGSSDVSVADSSSYGNYDRYASCVDYAQYVNGGGADGLVSAVPEVSSGVRVTGKKKRNEIPTEIVEVKQDELIKNRPREDQTKLTGIAFGPAYQPVSSKGKPSKLHKRKHQIGSLYFDMKQKETELAERRARGFLTKGETQAKYGW